MSLAGLYYYFDSKEKLLYLIEKQLFARANQLLDQKLQGISDPEQRMRLFIENHVEFFLSKQKAMKVLAHEDDSLTGKMASEIADIKRHYYRRCTALLEELKRTADLQFRSRSAAMALFGMMNWLHTWYNPKWDGPPSLISKDITEIFLTGVYATKDVSSAKSHLNQDGAPASAV